MDQEKHLAHWEDQLAAGSWEEWDSGWREAAPLEACWQQPFVHEVASARSVIVPEMKRFGSAERSSALLSADIFAAYLLVVKHQSPAVDLVGDPCRVGTTGPGLEPCLLTVRSCACQAVGPDLGGLEEGDLGSGQNVPVAQNDQVCEVLEVSGDQSCVVTEEDDLRVDDSILDEMKIDGSSQGGPDDSSGGPGDQGADWGVGLGADPGGPD